MKIYLTMEELSDERILTVVNFSSEKYYNSRPKKYVDFFLSRETGNYSKKSELSRNCFPTSCFHPDIRWDIKSGVLNMVHWK